MLRRFRIVAAAIAALALVGTATPAAAGSLDDIDPNSVPPAFDLLVLRPVGLAATVVGAAAFVPAGALTAIFHRPSMPMVFDWLVRSPYEFTFEHPIGTHGEGRGGY